MLLNKGAVKKFKKMLAAKKTQTHHKFDWMLQKNEKKEIEKKINVKVTTAIPVKVYMSNALAVEFTKDSVRAGIPKTKGINYE